MSTAIVVLVGVVAALHVYFLVLEMFLWQTPFGRRTFGTTVEQAKETAVLAANQGLYNGFLAAGLVASLIRGDRGGAIFFLACVVVAGVYGAVTANPRILFVQAVPAVIPLALLSVPF